MNELNEPQKKLHNDIMLSAFWGELLENSCSLSNEEISIKIYNYQVPLDMTVPYLIVLFSIKFREGLSLRNEENMVHCIFRWENTGFFRISTTISGIVVPIARDMDLGEVYQMCDEYLRFVNDIWQYKVAAFIGTPLYMDKLTQHFGQLMAMEHQTVSTYPGIFMYEECHEAQVLCTRPNVELWAILLEKGMYDRLLAEIHQCLSDGAGGMQRQELTWFIQDFEQILYRYLDKKDITIYKYADEHIYSVRCDSVDSAAKYIEALILQIRDKEKAKDKGAVSDKIKEYIWSHMDGDITREELAEYVYLNPDYLGKVFKKETGIALKDYVIREKLSMAKELLSKTGIPVSEVALRCGYSNFAHFSTAFRKMEGVSPVNYRQQIHHKTNAL